MATRAFHSILSDDLTRSKQWYIDLLGYDVEFDSDWFVHLRDPNEPALEFGIMARSHEVIPAEAVDRPVGGITTFVVDDVDAVHAAAVERGVSVVEAPRDLFYGQRRLVLADPDGHLVDVSSECEPDPEWVATLMG